MLELITRTRYRFRQKLGRKSAEIGVIVICKHEGGKTADMVPLAENRQNSAQNCHSVVPGRKVTKNVSFFAAVYIILLKLLQIEIEIVTFWFVFGGRGGKLLYIRLLSRKSNTVKQKDIGQCKEAK